MNDHVSTQESTKPKTELPDEQQTGRPAPDKPASGLPAAGPNGNRSARQSGPPRYGTQLHGKIVSVAQDAVAVDVGRNRRALVPADQFDAVEPPETGREIEVIVLDGDDNDSLRANLKGAFIPAQENRLTPGILVDGKITGMIKGGLEVQLGNHRAFMPASHVDTSRIKDISVFLGRQERCEVIEMDPEHKNIIVSRKKAIERDRAHNRTRILKQLEVGQIRQGIVRNLTEYGAFVDLGGVHGLVHISDLSWTPVDNPADVVQTGDEVSVKVLKVNKERGRVSLGVKQAMPDPWSGIEQRHPPGSRLKVRVVKLADFGAFAEVEKGVNGLIPLGEMSWNHRPAQAGDVVTVGDDYDVVVINVDAKRRRIGLSIKQTSEDPWANVQSKFAPDTIVTGEVTKILEFGALVELSKGIEGMIHISELSHQRVRSAEDVVKVGDSVTVKVLSVDPKKRRIALSIKATAEPAAEPAAPEKPSGKKKRKRPLRGGLTSHFEW
jgi:small subunit ribosomal protein S1